MRRTDVAIRPATIGTAEHRSEEALEHGTNGPSPHGNGAAAARQTDADLWSGGGIEPFAFPHIAVTDHVLTGSR